MREREREWVGNTERGRTLGQVKDPRVWNREEYRRLESESFSIFVDNLPFDISRRELFQLFNWTGRINDIYLSRKHKNGGLYIFAFIRYTTKGGASKAIAEMNHMRLRGNVIFVGEAKYRRTSEVKDANSIPQRGDRRNATDRQVPEEGEKAKKNTDSPNKVLISDNKVQDPPQWWTKKK
ncbi:serine/arginine-rich SC35-like splicing factor SCL28 [Arachis stenosperma]|uniref:serine/arginine-rich SC35-like splicing factor SCL28 n=1 Tax=Arachis stenosperma TaxID=217475 RepID=UPI0025ABC9FE|nr:serine/arginine-rich SC35-like splicing factor SCL28 [Arachis stenosperma]